MVDAVGTEPEEVKPDFSREAANAAYFMNKKTKAMTWDETKTAMRDAFPPEVIEEGGRSKFPNSPKAWMKEAGFKVKGEFGSDNRDYKMMNSAAKVASAAKFCKMSTNKEYIAAVASRGEDFVPPSGLNEEQMDRWVERSKQEFMETTIDEAVAENEKGYLDRNGGAKSFGKTVGTIAGAARAGKVIADDLQNGKLGLGTAASAWWKEKTGNIGGRMFAWAGSGVVSKIIDGGGAIAGMENASGQLADSMNGRNASRAHLRAAFENVADIAGDHAENVMAGELDKAVEINSKRAEQAAEAELQQDEKKKKAATGQSAGDDAEKKQNEASGAGQDTADLPDAVRGQVKGKMEDLRLISDLRALCGDDPELNALLDDWQKQINKDCKKLINEAREAEAKTAGKTADPAKIEAESKTVMAETKAEVDAEAGKEPRTLDQILEKLEERYPDNDRVKALKERVEKVRATEAGTRTIEEVPMTNVTTDALTGEAADAAREKAGVDTGTAAPVVVSAEMEKFVEEYVAAQTTAQVDPLKSYSNDELREIKAIVQEEARGLMSTGKIPEEKCAEVKKHLAEIKLSEEIRGLKGEETDQAIMQSVGEVNKGSEIALRA